ncbi:MAG: T9SS type A sorting domain-containing protein, partial [Chlamydiia bacterium]|nr:T9SS type A sorting domain-containing protein [Chlamydiia bacterium]
YPEDENTVYTWEFGDGTTAEGMETTHTYTAENTYNVILTTTLGDCIATSTQTVTIGENTGDYTIFGSIVANNSPLDYGVVVMHSAINDSIGDDGWYEFSTTIVNPDGSYVFNNVPDGEYLIIAFPDYNSMYFETHLPTYYGDVIFWEDATVINPINTNGPSNITLVQAEGVNTGEGIINGDIVDEGFKSQLEDTDISLFLIDENNQALAITYSETNGSFNFSEIAFGTYTVYAEITGLPTTPAEITLSSENPTANITIEITPNGVISGIENITSVIVKEVGNIYPNPVVNQASFAITLKTQTIINIYIYNQIGQLIQFRTVNAQEGNSNIKILTNKFHSGVYTMKLVFEDGASINQKFVK